MFFFYPPFLVFLWIWTQWPLTWGVKVPANSLWGNVVEMPGTEQVGRRPSQNSSEELPGPQRESSPIESALRKKEKRTSPLRKDPLPRLPQEARGKRRLKLPARSSSLVRANSLAFSDCNLLSNDAMFGQWSQILFISRLNSFKGAVHLKLVIYSPLCCPKPFVFGWNSHTCFNTSHVTILQIITDGICVYICVCFRCKREDYELAEKELYHFVLGLCDSQDASFLFPLNTTRTLQILIHFYFSYF